MEDLISSLSSSFQVSNIPNSTAAPHPRYAQYKMKHAEPPQETRRRKFLEAQKQKRYDYVSHARCLAENDWSTIDDEYEEEKEEMDWTSQPKKPPRSYKDQLMLSEWLVEIPNDFASQWLMIMCPIGKRSLIVASKGQTKAYTKSGYLVNTFPSHLPGGNKNQQNITFSAYSLLDCIYNELDKTYYILDIMCWNSHPVFDSETEFRFFWMHSKINEVPEVMVNGPKNYFKFIPLPYYSCDPSKIQETMWESLPFPAKLDGLLFYHKQTHYIPGTTPLVGWLKAYMLPEILNIPVPEIFLEDKPKNYASMEEHLNEAFDKHKKRKEQEKEEMLWQEVENVEKETD